MCRRARRRRSRHRFLTAMSKKSIYVRSAERDDAMTIADFNISMAMETEKLALDSKIIISGVYAVFVDPSRGQYLVAEIAGRIVGCLLITHEWSDWRNGNIWWI